MKNEIVWQAPKLFALEERSKKLKDPWTREPAALYEMRWVSVSRYTPVPWIPAEIQSMKFVMGSSNWLIAEHMRAKVQGHFDDPLVTAPFETEQREKLFSPGIEGLLASYLSFVAEFISDKSEKIGDWSENVVVWPILAHVHTAATMGYNPVLSERAAHVALINYGNPMKRPITLPKFLESRAPGIAAARKASQEARQERG